MAEFGGLAAAAGLSVLASTYDGDTPAPIRSAVRAAGQVVVTNPDMLHSAILPHHTKWFQLFEQLKVIVIDELHTYRGVFGGHVANVLRRLLRICAHYGSHPVIVCCSATIGNPGELAAMLTGRPARLVDRNGAPAGERHVVLVDPPIMEPASGARGSAVTLAQRWALPFLRAGRQTIVFGRSRVAVELLLTGLRESLRESYGPRSRVRGYRGGYLPTERRSIEHGLRDGEVLGVVATNALELGVDIGRLDVSILAGYPGSVAATWQQFGRAGRRQGTSVAILVASGAPVDQYVIHHPEFLLEGTPEEARLDPDNLHVLLAHLRAATFELPFEPVNRCTIPKYVPANDASAGPAGEASRWPIAVGPCVMTPAAACTTAIELSDASIVGAAVRQLTALFAERSTTAATPFAMTTTRMCSLIVPATFSRNRATSAACAPAIFTRENCGGAATLVSWNRESINSRNSVR